MKIQMGFKAYNNNPKLSCHDTSTSIQKLIHNQRKFDPETISP